MSLLSNVLRTARLLARIPYIWRQWNKIWRAQEEGDWALIEKTVVDLHRHDFVTPQTRFLYGCSLAHASRWQEALEQFEMIDEPLDDERSEAVRWFNHALALRHLGRGAEAVAILKAEMSDAWSAEDRRDAEELIRDESPSS